jgi:hypothetical protein
MDPTTRSEPHATSPVDAARVAIWRLFEEGYVDEDMATAGLLAVDLGTRRTQRRDQSSRHGRRASSSTPRRAA